MISAEQLFSFDVDSIVAVDAHALYTSSRWVGRRSDVWLSDGLVQMISTVTFCNDKLCGREIRVVISGGHYSCNGSDTLTLFPLRLINSCKFELDTRWVK